MIVHLKFFKLAKLLKSNKYSKTLVNYKNKLTKSKKNSNY